MQKKTLWLIAGGVLILALLLGAVPLVSHVVYHRSRAATLLAWQFRKDRYTTEAAFEDYLSEKRAENREKYALPEGVEPAVPVTETEAAGMQVFILNGAASPRAPVIWYFPGGSYIDQPAESHWQFVSALASDTGAAVYVPIYPKLPDADAAVCSAALTEAYAALMTGMVHGELIFMGDSAGGGLALSFAMALRDAGLPGPEKLILLSPWVDVTMENTAIPAHEKKDPVLNAETLRRLGILWAGDLETTDPLVSPLYGDLTGLGEIIFFTTDGELLYPDHLALEQALTGAGAPHEMIPRLFLFHCWPLFAYMGIPESREAYEQILGMIG